MARRVSPAQLRSKLRQIEQKQKRAINDYNRAVRQRNQAVKQAVSKYNQGVRAHNARVRANRQRLKSELQRLSRQPATQQFTVYRTSVQTLYGSYERLEERAGVEQFDSAYNHVLDLSEREMANSVAVANTLDGVADGVARAVDTLENAALLDKLRGVSTDLDARWKGAVFALDPRNPDAARHFCTSAREIVVQILEIKAPDDDVQRLDSLCELTPQGKPTRRAKLNYLLSRKGLRDATLTDFVDNDVSNILELFRTFNDGTHGSAGTFGLVQLQEIRKRVEDGINFLVEIGDA